MRYWDSLGMDAQAVMREAKRQLENVELEHEFVLQSRRLLLASKVYDPCAHVRYDRQRRRTA